MTSIASSLIGTVSTETIDTPLITTAVLVLANNEYAVAFPLGTKTFAIQNRGDGLVKLRSVSAGDHFTLFPGQPYYISNIKGTSAVILYMESPKAGQIVEIIAWS